MKRGEQRTSDSHPIQLGLIEDIWAGKLGITFAPGKIQKNAMTGCWNRCLQKDLAIIKNKYNIDVLVCLLQKAEMKQLQIQNLLVQCNKLGIITEHFEVVDNTVPKNEKLYKQLVVKVVDQYLRKGKNVVVHCKGGLGRAGTFAAACLIYNKVSPKDAIKIVRKARPNTINCISQQEWLLGKISF